MSARTCVIIPFYQRQGGILQKAVRSALSQKGFDNFVILIVDDGSPVPARQDLKDFLGEFAEKIIILEQENSGVAAARNKGLDNVPQDCKFVAFLDSDDEWTEQHLSNAVQTLELGYDFYFADFYQLGQTVSAFNRAKRIDVSRHPCVAGMDSVHEYQGDMLDQIIRGNVIGTSVVAYSFRKLDDLRFREEFRCAGEDYLFWSDIALRTNAITFSSKRECRYGSGVNIFSENSWGTDKYLRVRIDEARYSRAFLDEYPISVAQRRFITANISGIRESFMKGLINHAIRRRGFVSIPLIRDYMRADRGFLISFPVLALKIAFERALRWRP